VTFIILYSSDPDFLTIKIPAHEKEQIWLGLGLTGGGSHHYSVDVHLLA